MNKKRPNIDFRHRLPRLASWMGGSIVLLSAVAITIDVLTRNLVGRSYLQSFELSQYGFAIAVAFGLSAGVVNRDHIRIDVLVNALPVTLRRLLNFVSIASLVLLSALLAYFAFDLTWDSYTRGARSPTSLRVYTWIPQSIWMLGLFVFAAVSIWTLLKSIKSLVIKDYRTCDSLIGLPGPEDHK